MRVSQGIGRYLLSLLLLAGTITAVLGNKETYAAQIVNRTLTLVDGAGGDGGSTPGGTVNHLFTFDIATTGNVGSIKLEYCTIASVEPCVTPTGLVTTSATLGSEAGSDLTGFSVVNTTNGAPYLSRTASSATAGDTVNVQVNTIDNPTTTNYTFFVRISTYASTDTTGSAVDTGTVAASTAEPIVLTGVMPESLIFCTGAEISAPGGIPDCTTATAGDVSFNQLFSPTDTAFATSQMSASTNAQSGYSITVTGPTLTSGGNTITAMSSATTSAIGTGQFGMNLMSNTTPTVGADVNATPDGVDLKGQPATDYDTADSFKFASGDSVANSANGGAGGTNAQIFTVSYIVNVPGNQPAGSYVSTLTYICTPTF